MIARDEHFRKLERMYASAPINEHLPATLRVAEGEAEVIIQIQRNFFHAAGATHGSVYFRALDDAAFFAVSSLEREFFVVTISFNIYLMRPVSSGAVRSDGRIIQRSKRVATAESVLYDETGQEIGRGSGTFMPSRIPLSTDLGYA